MSRTFGLVTAATLLASVAAFAQTSNTMTKPATSAPSSSSSMAPGSSAMGNDSASTDATPSSPKMAADDTANSTDDMKKPHHHRHAAKSEGAARTDEDANKLNACMVDANPTATQEDCLKRAENS
jgi:hypothetical protein